MTTLHWNSATCSGSMQAEGVYRHFAFAPRIKGLPSHLELLDYSSEAHVATLQEEGGDAQRAMRRAEVRAVCSYIETALER